MNNLVVATEDLYARYHKVYSMSVTSELIPEVSKWSWRRFRSEVITPAKTKYIITIYYSIFNEVTRKLENDNQKWKYADLSYAKKSFDKMCEQLKAQDPALRYVDDALQDALVNSETK